MKGVRRILSAGSEQNPTRVSRDSHPSTTDRMMMQNRRLTSPMTPLHINAQNRRLTPIAHSTPHLIPSIPIAIAITRQHLIIPPAHRYLSRRNPPSRDRVPLRPSRSLLSSFIMLKMLPQPSHTSTREDAENIPLMIIKLRRRLATESQQIVAEEGLDACEGEVGEFQAVG